MIPWMQAAQARAAAWVEHVQRAGGEWHPWMLELSGALMSGTGVRAVTYALILLVVGASIEWLYWTYAYSPLRALRAARARSAAEALRLGLRQWLLQATGIALFTAATIAASAGLDWPEGVHDAVVMVCLWLLIVRLAWSLALVVLAPGRRARRLAPVADRHAAPLAACVVIVAMLAAAARFLPELVQDVGHAPHSAGVIRLVLGTLVALVLLWAAFAFFARPGAAAARSRLPAFPRAFTVAALVALCHALWLLAPPTLSTIAISIAAVIVLQMVLRAWVFHFWAPADGQLPLAPHMVLSAARFAAVALGLGACAATLDTPLTELATRQGPLVRFAFSLLGIAALGLLTHLVWIAARGSIDRRLQRIQESSVHGEPGPEARLLTLLPLLRVSTALALLVLLTLSALWALGIEITPLLAGAGVIGLAVGFGAQALVRDVIAGVFYLAEDAFRVGEYIESGTSTRGTVERITLRTVALRHHNGPLHFVPYGALGTVRNNSRDWVIEKFNLPLPIEVDSEQVRKLIKKVGEAMLQDPEVGHLLREPLKGKLYRIDPGVKVFRCKFETAPGKQFDVRAQAIKRLEAALKGAGIGFADGRQTVYVQPGPQMLQIEEARPLPGPATPAPAPSP